MAIYPDARVRLISPGRNDPRLDVVVGAILHVDAGNSKSLYGYFNGPSGGIESHFHVPKEHQVEQYRDTQYEADANRLANSFEIRGRTYGYISIETQGYGQGEWNAYQLREIKELLTWLSRTHDFPLRRCPAHASPGVGYHVMFGAPGPWTPVAKSCPGPDRVRQFNNILVPWMVSLTSRDVTIAAQAVQWAAAGTRPDLSPGELLLTDSYAYDAHQFMAVASPGGLGVIPMYTFNAWLAYRDDPVTPFGRFGCELVEYAVRCVQAKAGIKQTGYFGAETAAYIEQFGYNVT